MPLDPIGISLADMMLKHISELTAIPNQWTAKDKEYLQHIQRALVHFKTLWEAEPVASLELSHELRTPFGTIIGYRELIEFLLAPPVKEEITEHLVYLEIASKALLCKINEMLDGLRSQNQAKLQFQNAIGIDTESLELIDKLLDAVIELRLMPVNRTALQRDIIEELHAALLRLNHYWQVLDSADIANLRLVESVTSLLVWLVKLLKHDYKGENGLQQLQALEKFSQIVEAKVRYFSEKAYTIDSLN